MLDLPYPSCPCGLTRNWIDDCPACHWDWPEPVGECVVCGRDAIGGLCPTHREEAITEQANDLADQEICR